MSVLGFTLYINEMTHQQFVHKKISKLTFGTSRICILHITLHHQENQTAQIQCQTVYL